MTIKIQHKLKTKFNKKQASRKTKIEFKDQGQVLKTYRDMGKQFQQVFKEFKFVKLPTSFKKINKVVVCGMGGSALGPDLVRTVFSKYLKIPIIIINDYSLPNWVDEQSLVIISSFSGNTEEIISSYKQARRKKFKILVVTSGGQLARQSEIDRVDKDNIYNYIYQAKYNYAQNPRFAVAYSIAIFISLFKSLKLLNFCSRKIKREIDYFIKGKRKAQKIAKKIKNKIPILIASEHLVANMHIWQNQFNETGKNFASYFSIPEICHHQFEGLSNPRDLSRNIIYVLLNSNLYHSRNQKRYQIMKKILKQRKINFIEIDSRGDNVWSQSMYILGLSSYSAFYLAKYNKLNPQINPWVDLFKAEMNK